MADQKISALTELTTPAAADEFVVVDKSDTSMAATGTDKRITYDTLLDEAFATYKLVYQGRGTFTSAVTAGTYLFTGNNVAPVTGSSGLGLFYYDPADWTAGSRTTTLRVRVAVATNATASTVNFTAGLYPIASSAGATSGQPTLTQGTVTSGSTVLFTAPAASSLLTNNSGDFTAPTAGFYALGCVVSGTSAVNSGVSMWVGLQMRQV